MKRAALVLVSIGLVAASCTSGPRDVAVGAMYPTQGGQGPGGVEEYRGVRLAADFVNRNGGVHGRPIRLELVPADSADAVPGAMHTLMSRGVKLVLGSYGSTMSAVAARIASHSDVVLWETGAVGLLPQVASGHVFRVPATGESLGRAAVEYVHDKVVPGVARYGVAYVDDVYGRSVGDGAIRAVRALGAQPVAFPYAARGTDFAAVARRIGAAHVDVLVVGAYLQDGVALRRALVAEHVPLKANIGTSSSYCMPQFGAALGTEAVGVFASDKPDADSIPSGVLTKRAEAELRWAQSRYRSRYHEEMEAPALTGFAGALALFADVLPAAGNMSVDAVARAARRTSIPSLGLPNGSGLRFDAAAAGVSENARAASVIWEWVAPNKRAVIWPPVFVKAHVTWSGEMYGNG
jgi:branched-chain amino acid transport system substrate-binding protein